MSMFIAARVGSVVACTMALVGPALALALDVPPPLAEEPGAKPTESTEAEDSRLEITGFVDGAFAY